MKLLFWLLLLCPVQLFAAGMPEDLTLRIKSGIGAIHSLQFDKAEKDFDEILEKYPGQPYGYFGRAMSAWARLEYEKEESDPELDKIFSERTEEAVRKGEEWLDKYPKDADAHLCVGGMYGLKSRLLIMQHSWLKAYTNGKRGLRHMKKALKLNPELYDAYLGPGMYEYYAGTLPAVIKLLAKLLVNGNAKKGIEYLEIVKDKGQFTADAAKLLLIEIFTQTGSKYANPAQAVVWAKELREKRPYHPLLHFVEIVALYENKQWGEVRSEAEEYIKRINENVPFYGKIYMPRARIALATSYLAEHNWEQAAENYRKAAVIEDPAKPNRWAVWAMVRLGNVYDIEGKRALAVEEYKKALAQKDLWGFKDYIKKYISRPYAITDVPGQLPPP